MALVVVGSAVVQLWFWFDSGLVQIWFGVGAALCGVWLFGSATVQRYFSFLWHDVIWFSFGSDLVQLVVTRSYPVQVWLICGLDGSVMVCSG